MSSEPQMHDATMQEMTENHSISVTITWFCDNDHPNSVDVELDMIENKDVDGVIMALVCDTSFHYDNPCHCGDIVQQEVDWTTSVIDAVSG